MKNLKTLLLISLSISNYLNAAVVLPPFFKTTYSFEIRGDDREESPKALVELMSYGEQNPALLSFDEGKKVFLMKPPRVDRCGFIHFEGNSVSLESQHDVKGDEFRFFEESLRIDISCHPIPFPRCGNFTSTESRSSGEYLMEQLQLLRAECQAVLIDQSKLVESYQIHLPQGFQAR